MSEARQATPVKPGPEIKRFRRIVTGHDAQGRSVILSDHVSPHVMPIMGQPNFAVTDFWKTASTPADNGVGTKEDLCGLPIQVAPPANGSVFRLVQFPPDEDWAAKAAAMGGSVAIDETAKAAHTGGPVRHAHMHRTHSIDYAIVLSGEIWAVMDEGETKMIAGDVLIQRGTNHAWANRSNAPCVVAFVLIDAKPLDCEFAVRRNIRTLEMPMKPHPKNIGDHLYVAVLLPFDRQMKIDEAAYRSFLQYFLKNEKFVRMGGGLCINPEAGEIFYLTQQEKRRVLEIAMEEVNGKVPVLAGTWAMTTDETVETARDCKAMGVNGIFVTPPGGAQDVTSCWDADNYPEIWLDQIIAQDRAVDLPIVTHPVGGAKPPFYPGLPLEATLRICREVPNVVGWKMTYMYDGFRLIANGLRGLNHHVAVMGALASRFHEYKATGMFDGTLSGFWNFALEPMLDHLEAWDAKDIDKARRIWDGGLVQLHEYVADMGRLHIRYKTATWLRGLIPNPFMRSPMPKPKQQEV
ncbi:MAG: dihydrodipicolinate synthase family protein, partial [Pseudolabrys sp.]